DLTDVAAVDAADTASRHAKVPRSGEQCERRTHGPGFDCRRKKTAEGDVVGGILHCPLRAGEVVVAGDADDGSGAEAFACVRQVLVVAAEMNAVGTAFAGKHDVVIDDERCVMSTAQRGKFGRLLQAPLMVC